MWKKLEQDGVVDARPEFAPKETPDLEAPGDALLQSLVDGRLKRENLAAGPQKVLAQDHTRPLPSPTMETYTKPLNEVPKNPPWFIYHPPLPTQPPHATH